MKNFVYKALLFLVILISVLFLLQLTKKTYHWGNRDFSSKLNYFNANRAKYNTLVFGSSRLYRQVNTQVFDSILITHGIHTYNLATPGTFNPESYYLYENFINSLNEHQLKYALLELQNLRCFTDVNNGTTKGCYWHTPAYFKYSLNYIAKSGFNKKYKQKTRKIYTKNFTSNLFNLSHITTPPVNSTFTNGINGYYSLNQEINESDTTNECYIRRKNFMKDSSRYSRRIDSGKQFNQLMGNSEYLNKAHLDYINKLITLSKDKGVHLFLVIPPKQPVAVYMELAPIYHSVSKSHIIQLADYYEFTELYNFDNTFDLGHLNSKGANIFTILLAQRINEIISGDDLN
ncbi:MAG: hypothetical protein MI922_11940 [Bacteroidales bacterium]|nr:hypothetical protein [Bacteroidales bacterium]